MLKNKARQAPFIQRLLELVSDPAFIKCINIQTEPNIFRIVGRTHYERWHSAFLGWLLDAQGSHLLGDYVLTRLLYLLLDERCLKGCSPSKQVLLELLPSISFSALEVVPNENIPTETNVRGIGRFDIFVTAQCRVKNNNDKRLNIIFELKIDSPTRAEQAARYAGWLNQNHPDDINLLIYIVPKLFSNSKATVGDDRWFCMDYQLLNDKLLLPILDHPKLNDKVKPFIIQYVKNLNFRYRGIKMAITNEEKKLALELYERYSDVLDSIYDALQSESVIDYTTSDTPKGRTSGKIAVKIDGQIFSAEILRDLLRNVLVYIVDKNYVTKLPLPWGTSKIRFILTNQNPPVHPNGRNFFNPVEYKNYVLETHYARDRGLKVLDDLCQKLELDFEVIDV